MYTNPTQNIPPWMMGLLSNQSNSPLNNPGNVVPFQAVGAGGAIPQAQLPQQQEGSQGQDMMSLGMGLLSNPEQMDKMKTSIDGLLGRGNPAGGGTPPFVPPGPAPVPPIETQPLPPVGATPPAAPSVPPVGSGGAPAPVPFPDWLRGTQLGGPLMSFLGM